MASFYDGAQVSMAPDVQSLDSLFNISGPAPLPSGGMSFAPNFSPTNHINNALQSGAPTQSFGFNQTNPSGLLTAALTPPAQSTPQSFSDRNPDQSLTAKIGETGTKALSSVNELFNKLFAKENQGTLAMAGALLTAGGQRSAAKSAEKEKSRDRDWQKQMEDLKQKYAKENYQLRMPQFEGNRKQIQGK